MKVNFNIASLTSQRNLSQTTRALARTLARLGSGSRINSAQDDPAGLAIGTRLNSQIREKAVVGREINSMQQILNTAAGSLSTSLELIGRMREIALQAANGTLSSTDREYLDSEFQTLLAEYSRVIETANFNGTSLFNGDMKMNLQLGTDATDSINVGLSRMKESDVFTKTVKAGTGSYTNAFTGPTNYILVTSEDFNGDGLKDIMGGGYVAGGFLVSLNNGDGTFSKTATYSVGGGTTGLKTGDFNGDGHTDILANNFNAGGFRVYFNDGSGTFTATATVAAAASQTGFYGIGVGDLNSDGKDDLIRYEATDRRTYLSNGDGTFRVANTLTESPFYGEIATGDIDNDGKVDFVDPAGNSVRIFYGNGTDSPDGPTVLTVGTGNLDASKIEDLNNDGLMDVITQHGGDGLFRVHMNNGNRSFTTSSVTVGDVVRSVNFADLNGDGYQDIVSRTGASTRVLLNNKSGGFTTTQTLSTFTSLSLDDINQDGSIDLVAANSATNAIETYLGRGDGTFGYYRAHAVGGSPFITTDTGIAPPSPFLNYTYGDSIDFNDDGVTDLAYGTGSTWFIGVANTQDVTYAPTMDIRSQESAADTLELLDTARKTITGELTNIGAQSNRLDHAISINMITSENLSSAKSNLMDADVASETAELSRLQILQQAQVSVLGQANTNLQIVLDLLRGF